MGGRWLCVLVLCALGVAAERRDAQAEDMAGDFTHYILALSWNAAWCALEGDRREADQCDPRHDLGFTLHGLWPQRARDWPQYCRTEHSDPSRRETRAMADIMGSDRLAWHQWKKHGRCSDLSAEAYFALSREAYGMIHRPAVLRQVEEPVRIDPDVVEDAFLEANPRLKANQIAVTCKGRMLQEVRVCLTKGLVPTACSARTERGCTAKTVTLPPMR